MSTQNLRTDTAAWILQVWLSFSLAASAMAFGIYHLPVDLWVKGFLAMGALFSVGSTFTLSKTIRDNRDRQVDTSAWILQVWISFSVALFMMTVGVLYLPVDLWVKGYVGVGMLFTIGSTFTLAKTIRDNHEARQAQEASIIGQAEQWQAASYVEATRHST
jgi:hypothetical protein